MKAPAELNTGVKSGSALIPNGTKNFAIVSGIIRKVTAILDRTIFSIAIFSISITLHWK